MTGSARAETIVGPAQPMDGDTFEIAGMVVRLLDVDAPEMSQKCEGRPTELRSCGAVRRRQAGRTDKRSVSEIRAIDEYNRRLASCSHASEDLSSWLVPEGLASSPVAKACSLRTHSPTSA
jgi:endonuclease YncB( thermonuclease family)